MSGHHNKEEYIRAPMYDGEGVPPLYTVHIAVSTLVHLSTILTALATCVVCSLHVSPPPPIGRCAGSKPTKK